MNSRGDVKFDAVEIGEAVFAFKGIILKRFE